MNDDIINQIEEMDENLHKWFKEKWVRFGPDGKIRGSCAREKSSEGKPKCRPLKSAQAMGKKARATAASRKRREDPNPDRSGKAKNVKTEDTIMENHICPICGGELVSEALMNEKKDACYYKVKSRYSVWPSAYACVPEKTSKALTRDGWKSVDGLMIGDEIMTFNMEKDILEFKPILNLYRYKNVQTNIIKSGNTGFIFECTPNHKWVVKLPTQKSDKTGKYEKINDMSLIETSDLLNAKRNKHLIVSAKYNGGTSLKKDKIFKYGDNWIKYILDISQEQRQSWLFSAIVYDGNQIKTERILEKNEDVGELDWKYSGNHGKQSFGFKQKNVEHRDAFLLAAFLNSGTVTWKEHNSGNIYSCYYVSNKRYKNVSNFKNIRNNVADVWCPETENGTWVMMQETDKKGIITITGNSGALVKCRKKGAKNWGNKSEGFEEVSEACWKGYHKDGMKTMFGKKYPNCVKNESEEQQENEELDEKWSKKYKRSIDCSHPKGFSQKAHCQGRKKHEESIMKKDELKNIIKEMVEEVWNEQSQMQDECWECYEAAMQEGQTEPMEECYRKTNLEMIPEGDEHTCEGDEFYEIYGDMKYTGVVEEAEYHGRKVKLGVPMRGDVKKSKVFVKNAKGNVVKVNFGDKNMRIKKSNPKRRKSFRARHNCANPGPRTSAKYWSCRAW